MGKKKKEIKDKKLQSIREANIEVHTKYDDKRHEHYLYISVDRIIEPSMRPRTTSRFSGMYDPLAGYKKVIENKIKEYINNTNLSIYPYGGPCRSVITIYKKPKKTLSIIDKFIYITQNLPVMVKPDIDNVEKTVWDIFNGIVIEDDSQIYSSKTVKRFSKEDKTIIKLYLEEENPMIKQLKLEKKRLSKEESEYIKSLYSDD